MAEKRGDGSKNWGIRFWGESGGPLWWCPGGNGYTKDIAEAGTFSENCARAQNGPRYEGSPMIYRDEAIPPNEMRCMAQEEVRRITTRLGNLSALLSRLDEVTP